jgi:hypothetical protein
MHLLPRPPEAIGARHRDLEPEAMIAEESIANVSARLNVFFASAREQAKDGLSWQEFGRLLVQLLWMSVEGLDAVASLTGPQKREVAVTAAAVLFDSLADKAVPVAAWPAWMLLRPATRLLVLSLAAGAVEALLRISRSST